MQKSISKDIKYQFITFMKLIESINVNKATVITGVEVMIPYLTKSKKEYFVSCSEISVVNMIPAKAPVGVKKAPILLPTIEANIDAWLLHIPENKILIGILLIRLLTKKDE